MGRDFCSPGDLLSYFASGPSGVFPDDCVAGVFPANKPCECSGCLGKRGKVATPATERRAHKRASREFAALCTLVRSVVEPRGNRWM